MFSTTRKHILLTDLLSCGFLATSFLVAAGNQVGDTSTGAQWILALRPCLGVIALAAAVKTIAVFALESVAAFLQQY